MSEIRSRLFMTEEIKIEHPHAVTFTLSNINWPASVHGCIIVWAHDAADAKEIARKNAETHWPTGTFWTTQVQRCSAKKRKPRQPKLPLPETPLGYSEDVPSLKDWPPAPPPTKHNDGKVTVE